MADIRDGIIIRTSFLFASFSVPSFLTSFKRFWSNETGKGSLSKVVQQVRKYLQLNFQKDWSSTSEVMADIRDGIIIIICTYQKSVFKKVVYNLYKNSIIQKLYMYGIFHNLVHFQSLNCTEFIQ